MSKSSWRRRVNAAVLWTALTLLPILTWAGGLYRYELATPEVGLTAAGYTARAQDPSTVFNNPAGMTRLQRSEVQVRVQPVYFNVEFDPDSRTTTSGKDGDASTWLPAGSLFYVQNVTPDLKFGFATVGYFGLGLEYEDQWVGRYYVQEVTLQALGLQPAVGLSRGRLALGRGRGRGAVRDSRPEGGGEQSRPKPPGRKAQNRG